MEEYQEAIKEFTLAINLNSQFIKAYQYRGFIFSKLGFENRANADLNKAEDLKSVNVNVTVKPNVSYDSPFVQSNQPWNLIKTISLGNSQIKQLQFHLEQQLAVTSCANGTMKQWDLENNTLLNTLSGHSKIVRCLAFSSDSQFLASGSDDKNIILWDLRNKSSKILGDWKDRHTNSVLALAFSPSQHILISGGADKTVKIWHLDFDYAPYTIHGYQGSILAIAIAPDSNSFATGGEDNKLRIREMETGKLIRSIEHPTPISTLAFSRDSQLLAGGEKDGTIRLWNVNTGELKTIFIGHINQISSLSFSHDHQFLISGSWDHTVRVWDIDNSTEKQVITDHPTQILQASLNVQKNILTTASIDGSIKVWQ
ncbi:MAG: hypothetical protein AB4041_20040 [Microcystaceae cyanobacterium]